MTHPFHPKQRVFTKFPRDWPNEREQWQFLGYNATCILMRFGTHCEMHLFIKAPLEECCSPFQKKENNPLMKQGFQFVSLSAVIGTYKK